MPYYLSELPVVFGHLALGAIYGFIFAITCLAILAIRRKTRKLLINISIVFAACTVSGVLCPIVGAVAILASVVLPLDFLPKKKDNSVESESQNQP